MYTTGAASPYTVTYNHDFKDGYGPHNICIQCTTTNNAIDTFKFSIEQLPLNCDPILAPLTTQPTLFEFDYVSLGVGVTYDFE